MLYPLGYLARPYKFNTLLSSIKLFNLPALTLSLFSVSSVGGVKILSILVKVPIIWKSLGCPLVGISKYFLTFKSPNCEFSGLSNCLIKGLNLDCQSKFFIKSLWEGGCGKGW